MGRTFLAGTVSAALAWMATARGEAQPLASIELHWVAPAKCPGPEDVQARVRRLFGTETAVSPKERLVAEGTVVQANAHYRLSLIVRQESERAGVTRVFESTSCESLAGAAAVTLALLARGEVQSDRGASQPSPGTTGSSPQASDATPTTSGPPTTPPTPPPTAPADSPPASASPPTSAGLEQAHPATSRLSAALQVPVLAADDGILPSSAYGVGVGAGFRVRQTRVMLAGLLWLPQSDAGATPYGATYERRSGELSSCYSWTHGQFEVGPCLAATLEDVSADSSGPDVVGKPGHVSWLTLGVAAQAQWAPRGWAALFLRPILRFTTSRPTFAIEGVGPLYKVPLAAVGVEMGCEWIL